MDIIGVGIDATEIRRIADSIERWGDRFVHKVFTPGEIAYCRRKKDFASSFAAAIRDFSRGEDLVHEPVAPALD